MSGTDIPKHSPIMLIDCLKGMRSPGASISEPTQNENAGHQLHRAFPHKQNARKPDSITRTLATPQVVESALKIKHF
jgi:hypothetical protein